MTFLLHRQKQQTPQQKGVTLMTLWIMNQGPRRRRRRNNLTSPRQHLDVTTQAAFLGKMAQQQEEMQQKYFQHELKMQVVLKEHENRREVSRQRFESELRKKDEEARARMERERQRHQQTMMHKQMLFQAELMKRLFDDSKDK